MLGHKWCLCGESLLQAGHIIRRTLLLARACASCTTPVVVAPSGGQCCPFVGLLHAALCSIS